jgi:hypothetical protein
MSITLLYGCGQIETTVGDLGKARAFMVGVLGGGEIEQQMAAEITALFPPGDYAVEHFDCGQGLFQVNAPSPAATFDGRPPVHQAYLDRIGPCVTNLNYYVDDAVHARDLLTGMGAPTYIEGPSNIIPSLADYGPDNTREPDPSRRFYFLGSRDLIGFDLELMEPNFKRFADQTAQNPCFVQPRPAVGDGNLRLLRAQVLVSDLAATWANLVKLVAPASRSEPYDVRVGKLERSFRIGLGGLELEYRQPLAPGPLVDKLERYGPGVAAIAFAARDLDSVLTRARATGVQITPVDGEASDGAGGAAAGAYELESRDRVGFDTHLEPLRACPLRA